MQISQTFSGRLQQPRAEALQQIVRQQMDRGRNKLEQMAEAQKEKAMENAKYEIDFTIEGSYGFQEGDFLPTSSVRTIDGDGKKITETPTPAAQSIARSGKLKYLGLFVDAYV